MQICRRLSIDCFCVQRTQEQAEALKSALGDTAEDGYSSDTQERRREMMMEETENAEDCIEERHEKEETDTEEKSAQEGTRDMEQEMMEGAEIFEESIEERQEREGTNTEERSVGKKRNLENTEELLQELSELGRVDVENVKSVPKYRHVGLKRFNTRSRSKK